MKEAEDDMNTESVVNVIETIYAKLGIAANSFQDFVPELAKYKILIAVFWIISSVIIISLSALAIKYVYTRVCRIIKKEGEDRPSVDDLLDFPSIYVVSIAGGVLIIVFLCVLIGSVEDIVAWIFSPQASAVTYILDFFK